MTQAITPTAFSAIDSHDTLSPDEPARGGTLKKTRAQEKALSPLIDSVAQGDTRVAATSMRAVADIGLGPRDFVEANAHSLETGDWTKVASDFANGAFTTPEGSFLIVAPYRTLRQASVTTALGLIAGRMLMFPSPKGLDVVIRDLFGELRQGISTIVPFDPIALAGAFGGEKNEAFVVPDGFPFAPGRTYPALNNVEEQARRTSTARTAIRRIIDQESVHLLLGAIAGRERATRTQFIEYQYHEAGHASGIGLNAKLQADVLKNGHERGVEEHRADAVAFELAYRTLPETNVAELIASNLVTRLGLDAHRAGTIERDTDVECAFLTFASLVASSAIVIHNRKIAFVDPTPKGLVRATERMRALSVEMTRRELYLNYVEGIAGLFGSVAEEPGAKVLFNEYVLSPCRGLFRELR
jgi:hypothetical protein